MCRAGAVYSAGDIHSERIAVCIYLLNSFHHQLTLGVDRSFETAACIADIFYHIVPNGERAWCSVRALAHHPFLRHVGLTDLFRRHRLICPVETASRGLRLRI